MESTGEQIIPLRKRGDLQVAVSDDGITLQDPISSEYWRLSRQEYGLLCLLDGHCHIATMLQAMGRVFPDTLITAHTLTRFLSRVLRNGLVVPTRPGIIGNMTPRRGRWNFFSPWRLLSLRIPGINPGPILDRLSPLIQKMLSPWPLVIALGLVLIAAFMVLLRFDVIVSRLPTLAALSSADNLLLLACCWVIIKLLHEFAHAAVCRYFGRECREIGLLLLLFMPVFFCDVSDSWMLGNRWKRIAVSAAGIAIELVIAAVLTILWWLSVPGPLQMWFLNGMLVCSVSTLVFNGNPLLRYDGYHILADLVNIPNLAEQSRGAVGQVGNWIVFGEPLRSSVDSSFVFLLIYGILASVYRVLIMLMIAAFVASVFGDFDLTGLGQSVYGLLLLSAALPIGLAMAVGIKRLKDDQQGRLRASVALTVILIAIVGLGFWPFTGSVTAPFVIEQTGVSYFAKQPGLIVWSVSAGTAVDVGDPILRLKNVQLERQWERAQSRVRRLKKRREFLRAVRLDDTQVGFELTTLDEQLLVAERQVREAAQDVEELTIRARSTGVVLPVRNFIPAENSGLPGWNNSVLLPQHVGAYVAASTPICVVDEPDKKSVNIYVRQDHVAEVNAMGPAQLTFASRPLDSREGRVRRISSIAVRELPRELMTQQMPPSENALWHLVVVDLPNATGIPYFSTGTAALTGQRRSLVARLLHLVRKSFGG